MLLRLLVVVGLLAGGACGQADVAEPVEAERLELPEPAFDGMVSVEEALAARRSVRSYQRDALTTAEVAQVLWAAYGVTSPRTDIPALRGGLRTTPSAGATYPLEIYLVAGDVAGIEAGVYRYISEEHALELVRAGDRREELSAAALGQGWVREAPASVVWSAIFERTTGRYGARGRERYVAMEIGHSAQNVHLQCEALGLGTVAVGAFSDDKVRQVVSLSEAEEPLYIMPIGRTDSD